MRPQRPDSGAPRGKGSSSFERDGHWVLSLKGSEEDIQAAKALGLWASESLEAQPEEPSMPAGRQGREHTALCAVHAAPRRSGTSAPPRWPVTVRWAPCDSSHNCVGSWRPLKTPPPAKHVLRLRARLAHGTSSPLGRVEVAGGTTQAQPSFQPLGASPGLHWVEKPACRGR